MDTQQDTWVGWSGVAIATLLMLLASALILYPEADIETVLTALRLSSATTALPFILVFVAQPLATVAKALGYWLQANRRYLWLVLTFSHLIHLYQIALYYQLGQSCPLIVWLITSPLWITMVLFSGVELIRPQWLDDLHQGNGANLLGLLYGISSWYIWLIFTLAFGLGAAENHLPFYNIPAFVLYLSAAILCGVVGWRKRVAA